MMPHSQSTILITGASSGIGAALTILNKHDGWTVTTRDKSLSAQFEHSIGVTATGFEIFTASAKGLNCPPYV